MTPTPIFWARVLEKHGARGLLLAMGLAFLVSIILYVLLYYVIFYLFDVPIMVEVFTRYLISILWLIIFFLSYWKLVVKKKQH